MTRDELQLNVILSEWNYIQVPTVVALTEIDDGSAYVDER